MLLMFRLWSTEYVISSTVRINIVRYFRLTVIHRKGSRHFISAIIL